MENNRKIIVMVDCSESYGRELLKGVAKYANLYGPWIFCRMPDSYMVQYGIDGILEWIKEWDADGIIAQLPNTEDVQKLIDCKIPIIAQDFKERFETIPNITGNYKKAGYIAADHFLSKGFENFAFYGFNDRVWSRERYDGFSEKIKQRGFEVSVFEEGSPTSSSLWYYRQSPLSNWLHGLKKPVAIFTCDDNQGNNVIQAAKVAGINIPDELAVLGNDNDQTICEMSDPPLSSIAMDVVNAGYQAAELLSQLMENSTSKKRDIIVEPTLVIERHSTNILVMKDAEIAKAVRFIHENITKIINVKNVLDVVPLSRRALEKRFVKVLNKTIYQEIQSSKIEHISYMLLETKTSVLDIAIENGFKESKNLSRYFKKVKGMSPSQYRSKYSNGKTLVI